jgi:hypothetical protein
MPPVPLCWSLLKIRNDPEVFLTESLATGLGTRPPYDSVVPRLEMRVIISDQGGKTLVELTDR